MLSIEEIIREVCGEEKHGDGILPPGFRFHPTDEELVTFYLASKVFNGTFSGVDIAEVDLNRCEPWELPDVAKMGEREWYFFSLRDRKYPTGLRTNRATGAGYWKATGKDREVFNTNNSNLIGMKKTLVFYKGRAPRGEKTKWVMHEYRLDGHFSCRHTSKEEWVICRIYHKSGDKKNPLFQGRQAYHILQPCLPKLLETNPSTTSDINTNTNCNNTNIALSDQEYQLPLFQNPNYSASNINHQQNELKALISKYSSNSTVDSQCQLLPIINGFQIVQPTSFSPPRDHNNINPYPSPMLFKSLLSHQDYNCVSDSAWNQQSNNTTVPKHCKTELQEPMPSFSHFQTQATMINASHHNDILHQASFDHHYQNPSMVFDQIDDYGNSNNNVIHEMSTSSSANSGFNRPTFHDLTKLHAESCWPLDA